ncbi:MAG: hypothetical protein AAFY72_01125 [Cyanobacteria bacterium J06649_4]
MESFLVNELSRDVLEQLLNKLDPGYQQQPNGLYLVTLEGMDFLLQYSEYSLTCRKVMFTTCSPKEVNEWNGSVNFGSCHVEPDGLVMFKATHIISGGSSLVAIANYLSTVKLALKDFESKFPYVEQESTYLKSVTYKITDEEIQGMIGAMSGLSYKCVDGVYHVKYPIDPENPNRGCLIGFLRIDYDNQHLEASTYIEPPIFRELGAEQELKNIHYRVNRWNSCIKFSRACVARESDLRLAREFVFSHGVVRESIFRELHGFFDATCPDFLCYMTTGSRMFGPAI